MVDRIVARADLPAQVEELIILVGRERLLELLMGARTWDLGRGPSGLTLSVDGISWSSKTDRTDPGSEPPCRRPRNMSTCLATERPRNAPG